MPNANQERRKEAHVGASIDAPKLLKDINISKSREGGADFGGDGDGGENEAAKVGPESGAESGADTGGDKMVDWRTEQPKTANPRAEALPIEESSAA